MSEFVQSTLKGITLLLASFLLAGLPLVAEDRPNFLVIMTDDMGYSDLGCYGSEIKTPHLDKLAKGGLRYTQAYNTSKCWTTRISLLTGLYHIQSGRDFQHTALVSEVLGPAGYQCWWSGKHHANFNPHERGFHHFSGFLGGAINFWNPGNARPGEPKPGWGSNYAWAFDDKIIQPYTPDKDFYATDRFTDWALGWLDDASAKNNPFFLYLAYNAPHWPLHAHAKDIAKYENTYRKGYEPVRKARYDRQVKMGLFDPNTAPLSDPEQGAAEWKALDEKTRHLESMRMATHAAMVDNVDQNVGRVIVKLKAQGKLDNTFILFLVDNGASAERTLGKAPQHEWGSVGTFQAIGRNWANVANTPMRLWKATSHEGGINTPLIAHWPVGITKPGTICRETCHLIDFLPTWMELAGSKAQYPGNSKQEKIPPLEGISMVPSFQGKPLRRERPLFFTYGSGKAIRNENWKLVRNRASNWELYDLAKTRTETKDLAKALTQRVATMTETYEAWATSYLSDSYSVKQSGKKKPKDKKKKPKKPKN